MVMATITIIGGPAGEFSANIFEPRKISEKILRSLPRKQQLKTSGNKRKQADHGPTGGALSTMTFPPLPSLPPLNQTILFPSQGNQYFSRRCRITHAGCDEAASEKNCLIFAPVVFVSDKNTHGPKTLLISNCLHGCWPTRPPPPLHKRNFVAARVRNPAGQRDEARRRVDTKAA